MAKKTLVISSRNLDRFFLAVQAGTLHVGDNPGHPEGAVQGLHVVRIRCEVEVEDDRDAVPIEQAGVISPQVLRPGRDVQLTNASLSLDAPAVGSDSVVLLGGADNAGTRRG